MSVCREEAMGAGGGAFAGVQNLPKLTVAINGFGRIGRATLKLALQEQRLEVRAVNSRSSIENLAYLVEHDTVHGGCGVRLGAHAGAWAIDGLRCVVTRETDPAQLPWDEMGIDLVFECTGAFKRRPELERHLTAGARAVILSAPSEDDQVPTVVYGVSRRGSRHPEIMSCASCTTNCVAPIVEVMSRRFGMNKAAMTTLHAYTGSQAAVDGPSPRFRRGRAAASNLIPTTTGAARAVGKVLPWLDATFRGDAVRAPVLGGSMVDLTLATAKRTSIGEVNRAFVEESNGDRYRDVMGVSEDPITSQDILGDRRASVVDLARTKVVDGDLVRVASWYDNEWGYAGQMIRQAISMAEELTEGRAREGERPTPITAD